MTMRILFNIFLWRKSLSKILWDSPCTFPLLFPMYHLLGYTPHALLSIRWICFFLFFFLTIFLVKRPMLLAVFLLYPTIRLHAFGRFLCPVTVYVWYASCALSCSSVYIKAGQPRYHIWLLLWYLVSAFSKYWNDMESYKVNSLGNFILEIFHPVKMSVDIWPHVSSVKSEDLPRHFTV